MLFCFLLAQEQKRREMILARELKKPVEDMVLKDSKVIKIDDYIGLLELCIFFSDIYALFFGELCTKIRSYTQIM